jgi:alpha-1,2-mannosyltransferase
MPIFSPTAIDGSERAGKRPRPQYSIAARLGVILSVGMVIAIVVMVIVDPTKRSVSAGYMDAAMRFLSHEPLYDPEASGGFLYLPTFAAIYAPLSLFGLTVGDLIWRAFSLGLLAFAMLRVVRQFRPRCEVLELYGLALLIGLIGAAGAIRNGQSTTLLTAMTLLAFDAAYDRRFAKAAAWATLAIVAKPLGIVVWLLVGGTRPAALPWLVGCLAIALAIPYAYGDWGYVNILYAQFVEVIRYISPDMPQGESWADFVAILTALDIPISHLAAYGVRAVAAIATFAVAWWLMRHGDYLRAALLPATLACSYMLLFNPRAETNTYILMAVPFGLLAAYMLRETRQFLAGSVVVITCVALGTGAMGRWVMDTFDPWSKPLLLVIALVVCAMALLRNKPNTSTAG